MSNNGNPFETLLETALREDLGGEGDVTSSALFKDENVTAQLFSKETGILAGASYFERVMRRVDEKIRCDFFYADGDGIDRRDLIAEVSGKTVSILKGERTAINFLSFLSGIATKTNRFTKAAKEAGHAIILDTRKTIPGYRELSKYAVEIGGGKNHRMGLYDMILIKDNHIAAAGTISLAVQKARAKWGGKYKIEIECGTLSEVEEAIENNVDIIMLDNMNVEETKAAVALPHKGIVFEASGNMDLEKVKRYSAAGVDCISVGELTHSIRAFDFSLKIPKETKHA